jgi:hypothetical protein
VDVCGANPSTTIFLLALPNLTAPMGGVLDHNANKGNVENMTARARVRWKIKNEHNVETKFPTGMGRNTRMICFARLT